MIGTGVKTRYISGVVRDRESSIKGLPSGTEEFMPLGLGETQKNTILDIDLQFNPKLLLSPAKSVLIFPSKLFG